MYTLQDAGGEGETNPQLAARVEAGHHPDREYTTSSLYEGLRRVSLICHVESV